jgi:hypothetical protein
LSAPHSSISKNIIISLKPGHVDTFRQNIDKNPYCKMFKNNHKDFEKIRNLTVFRVFGKFNKKPGDPQTTTIKMRMLRTAIEKIMLCN